MSHQLAKLKADFHRCPDINEDTACHVYIKSRSFFLRSEAGSRFGHRLGDDGRVVFLDFGLMDRVDFGLMESCAAGVRQVEPIGVHRAVVEACGSS